MSWTALRDLAALAMAVVFACFLPSAHAQGGPPMVTDDPQTPGDGHWEVNLGAIGARMPTRKEVAAPDLDINYGWGERVQLKLDLPWVWARNDGDHWHSGLGDADIGVKWRFLDQEHDGISMSIYPQYSKAPSTSSIHRGLIGNGHQFFMPAEVSGEVGGIGLAAEVGRNFVSDGGPDEWIAGVVAGHECGQDRECMIEARTTQSPVSHLTLLNLGMHWKVNDSVALLGSVGHEFGTHTDDRHEVLFYIGAQFTR
jgi:hypothetical protein